MIGEDLNVIEVEDSPFVAEAGSKWKWAGLLLQRIVPAIDMENRSLRPARENSILLDLIHETTLSAACIPKKVHGI